MGSKRDNTVLSDEVPEPSNKRRRDQNTVKSKIPEPKTDATYGQRSVFPGLDHPTYSSDDDLEFEDEGDALAYLRSVRADELTGQEASSIPHLLVAPKAGPQLPPHLSGTAAGDGDLIDRSIYGDGVGDSRGYYYDGAYTAVPDTDSSEDGDYRNGDDWDGKSNHAATEKALREAYYASLETQFEALRARLHEDPPPELVGALDKDHGTYVGHFGAKSWTFRVWNHRIRHTDPLPVQIAAMDRRNALKLLRVILGGKFIRRGYELRERTSRWIWAILARLPGRGEMDYTEIGWIRELGKRAVLMMVSIAHLDALRGEVEDDLEGEDVEEAGGEQEAFLDEVEVDDQDEVVEDLPPKTRDPNLSNDTAEVPPPTDTTLSLPADSRTNTSTGDDDGEMDMELDDGEVSDSSSASRDIQADIAAAKARLLAQLENPVDQEISAESPEGRKGLAADVGPDELAELDEARARANMRATLNMILTVAGEFYGQRDLLEFRDPFPPL